MSANDVLHLDANFQSWCTARAAGLTDVEPFLYYVTEQILKEFNFADEDVRYGITDHPNDGGVDAFYFIAGRNTLIKDNAPIEPGTERVRLVIIQSKSSKSDTGFAPVDIMKFRSFSEDLLDLSKDHSQLTHKYQPRLLTLMQTFKDNYLAIAGNFPTLRVDFYLVTRGDEEELNPAATSEATKLRGHAEKTLAKEAFFHPVDTQRLLEYVKKRKPKTRSIKWSDQAPLVVDNKYVGLVKLFDYFEFLKDEDGTLNELIFESNVRGYQQNTLVNKQIRDTVKDATSPNFWLLNNGVTIITSGNVQPEGMKLNIEDPQIVNGLQTSREIFNHFSRDPADPRGVLVKVIPVSDDAERDQIIRATNSQNPMSSASLRSTDEIHRAIEALFKKYGLNYDRRKGFYKDQGKPIATIISVTELIQALVAILLGRPDAARARPGDYIRKDAEYLKLFGKDRIRLGAYLKCASIMRQIDNLLVAKKMGKADQWNVKFYIAYHLCCELCKSTVVTDDAILQLSSDLFGNQNIEKSLDLVWEHYQDLGMIEPFDAVAKGPTLLALIKNDLEAQHGSAQAHTKKAKGKKPKIKDILVGEHVLASQQDATKS